MFGLKYFCKRFPETALPPKRYAEAHYAETNSVHVRDMRGGVTALCGDDSNGYTVLLTETTQIDHKENVEKQDRDYCATCSDKFAHLHYDGHTR